tara:strand:+ start:272 stop:592 length:321 start_codon:yes stop_codon:yes gene_type:complete
MSKYYRIRATSMATYYSYIDSDNYPDVFDEEGNPKGYQMYMDGSIEKIQDSDFDLFDRTWDYGVDSVNEDWEFTDYEVINKEQYVNARTKEENEFISTFNIEKSGW